MSSGSSHTELAVSPEVAEHRRRGMLFLGLAVAVTGFVMAIQTAVNAKFLAAPVAEGGFNLSGSQVGILEAFRESCGIFALVILALLAGLAEPLVGALVLTVLAGGIAAYAFIYDYPWLIVASVVWSQGLHVWMPLPNSMALSLAEPGQAGRRLGQLGSAGAAGAFVGLGAAWILTHFGVHMRVLYIVAGAAALAASAFCLAIPRKIRTPRQSLVIRRKYGLYYLLSFLEGWRKQLFLCFAWYLLAKVHKVSLSDLLVLWLVGNVIGYFISKPAGRIIDRIGERPTLVFYYIVMTLLFVGYALVPNVGVLCGLAVLDNVMFVCSMALVTYVNKLAPRDEHTSTLSMGVAMNHIAAVAMPFLGGFLWDRLGYQWAFVTGSIAAVVSIAVAARLPTRVPKTAATVQDMQPLER